MSDVPEIPPEIPEIPISGGSVEASGATPEQRMKLFYGVCVPLRLTLTYIVYKNMDNSMIKMLVLLLSAFAIYSNLLGLNSGRHVWWDRRVHLFVSVAILMSVFAGKMNYVAFLMLFDIIFGIGSSIAIKPW